MVPCSQSVNWSNGTQNLHYFLKRQTNVFKNMGVVLGRGGDIPPPTPRKKRNVNKTTNVTERIRNTLNYFQHRHI